jgi:starch phosphorylase
LRAFADDDAFKNRFRLAKQQNKQRLSHYIETLLPELTINVDSLFDVQIKRMHEYKRQLLNVLHIITRYHRIIENPEADWLPRTVMFGGKAAPGYYMAKLVIRLINDVANVVNHDTRVGQNLKVVFLPNYSVSMAEVVIPAADLSEQISTAGTEASGTGNMKFALNGALTIGTWDGANIEIAQEVGMDNIFIFGKRTEEVQALRSNGYSPKNLYDTNTELRSAIDAIAQGVFSSGETDRYAALVHNLLETDHYLLLADYADYIATQERVDAVYRSPQEWTRRSILNVAGMGLFSSDRTIDEYAKEIWGVEPLFRA